VPVGVLAVVATSNVAVPAVVIDAGVNDGVAFAGSPVALKLTGPEKPFSAPIVIV